MLIRNNEHLVINYDPIENKILVTNKTSEHLRGTLLVQELPHRFPIVHVPLEIPPDPGLTVWKSWGDLPGITLKHYFESSMYNGLRFVFLESSGDKFVEEWSLPSKFDLGVRCPDRIVSLDAIGYFFERVYASPMEKVGQCFLDLGANMGAYSLGAMRSGYEKIVAVEPIPEVAQFLQDTFRDKVKVVPKAVWSSAGEVPMEIIQGELSSGASSIKEDGDHLLPSVTLDELLEDLDEVFLKMDIEGAEEEVVTSTKNWHKVVGIDLEIHEWLCDAQRIVDALRANGFEMVKTFTLHMSDYITITSWSGRRVQSFFEV